MVGETVCAGCRHLERNPDGLSKRTDFKDMKNMTEEERITFIAGIIQGSPGKAVLVMVDHGPSYVGKAARYINKIKAQVPGVVLIGHVVDKSRHLEFLTFRL